MPGLAERRRDRTPGCDAHLGVAAAAGAEAHSHGISTPKAIVVVQGREGGMDAAPSSVKSAMGQRMGPRCFLRRARSLPPQFLHTFASTAFTRARLCG
jgi:hypothetical protein